MTRAVKAARLRPPEDASADEKNIATEAFGRMLDVMRGKVYFRESPTVLAAATRVRELICGREAERVVHEGPDGGPVSVRFEWITQNAKKDQDNG